MNGVFHIMVAANERYMPGAEVACAGVAVKAKPETELHFHVFTEDVLASTIARMEASLKRLHPRSVVEQHVCDDELLKGLPYWGGSRMAAVRCLAANILHDVRWCLYLDCDILYLASVEEHFSYCDDSVYACVVHEESEGYADGSVKWIGEKCGLQLPASCYFNSGVMLFNFDKMRREGVPEKLMLFFRDHPDNPTPDQNALNAVFQGEIRLIPKKFNRLQIFLTDEKLAEGPAIHYVCGNPWLPKIVATANGRFRLWWEFAKKYGLTDVRISRRILVLKYLCYWTLKTPLIGRLFVKVCLLHKRFNAKGWRQTQTEYDVSKRAIVRALA